MEQQVVCIEVMVGRLPEWYIEAEHDYALEQAIERLWHRNPAYQDATVRATYGYNGPHIAIAYNDDGDRVFERECDLDATFQAVYDAEVAPYV
jgi:hypothetical protein